MRLAVPLAPPARAHGHRRLHRRGAGPARARARDRRLPRPGRRRPAGAAPGACASITRAASWSRHARAALRRGRLPDGQRPGSRLSLRASVRGARPAGPPRPRPAPRPGADVPGLARGAAYAGRPGDRGDKRDAAARRARRATRRRWRYAYPEAGATAWPRPTSTRWATCCPTRIRSSACPSRRRALVAVHNAFMAAGVREEVPGAEVARIPMPATGARVSPEAVRALRGAARPRSRAISWSAASAC